MAAVLSCGREAVLCDESAGALWEILAARVDEIVVCVPYRTVRRRPRSARDRLSRRPGERLLRETLDRRTFTLTDSELERRFLPIARRAGLPVPRTGSVINGFKVDFYWPDLGLIVETDGLRYHRTPAQQARDRVRDQAHTAAGFTPLRFTRAQVRFEPADVEATLAAVARRLRAEPA
jgi:very-short-patch-repair endonuclease